MTLEQLKEAEQAPEWMGEEGYSTLASGYLLENETPRDMYRRVSKAAASYYPAELAAKLETRFFDYMWNNWLCLASPVCSNMGTKRGLPISCYGAAVPDSISGIFKGYHEIAMLTKNGGGVGGYWGDVRGRGAVLSGNGHSEGIVPWLRVWEQTLQSVSQGGVRRGSGAAYLPVTHTDIDEFLDIRRPTGDISRRCLSTNFHHAIIMSDDFMQSAVDGDHRAREIWERALRARVETGEPYFMWSDNTNRRLPECYNKRNMKVKMSQLCNEVYLYSDDDHTYVCCLSSVNLARYDEWKDDVQFIKDCIFFLDAVMEEFIQKAEKIDGFEKAVRFAKKSRALGLGVLGWHTLLQSKMIPFDSFQAMQLNAQVFKKLDKYTLEASKELAVLMGVPEWCDDTRNTHRLAVAPTVSNALISGGVSQGVEPIIANYFSQKTSKGTYIRKNPALQKILAEVGRDDFEAWSQINKDGGSVRNLKYLSLEQKEVFATAREISQHAIVKQAGQRQAWIDQGQSINLFFAAPESLTDDDRKKLGRYVHEVHLAAWQAGLKGLYYLRSSTILGGTSIYKSADECKACEG